MLPPKFGAIAQLGERYTGSVEVSGSIPLSSTNLLLVFPALLPLPSRPLDAERDQKRDSISVACGLGAWYAYFSVTVTERCLSNRLTS